MTLTLFNDVLFFVLNFPSFESNKKGKSFSSLSVCFLLQAPSVHVAFGRGDSHMGFFITQSLGYFQCSAEI
jgi:hypothetical protein